MAYNDAYNFPKIYHMISVSHRELEGKLFNMINRNGNTPLAPAPVALPYSPYVDTALMYRNDATNIDNYNNFMSNKVLGFFDMTPNEVHRQRSATGKTVNSVVKDDVDDFHQWDVEFATLESSINGNPCYSGFLFQGRENTFDIQPGNITLLNDIGCFTYVTVVRLSESNGNRGTWDSLFTFGQALNSFSLYWGNRGTFEIWYGNQRMGSDGVSNPNTLLNGKNLIIVARVFEHTRLELKIIDLDTGNEIFNNSTTINPDDVNSNFKNATGLPFFIGCNHHLATNGTESLTYHTHGESLLYNRYLSDEDVEDTKNFLMVKWSPASQIPDLYIDWSISKLLDVNGDVVDDVSVYKNRDEEADASKYGLLDNRIMWSSRSMHEQTISGLPALLQGYDGDLTVVYHGLSMATGANSFNITTLSSHINIQLPYWRSGFHISLHNNNITLVIGRGVGNDISATYTIPQQPPYGDKVHTLAFTYEKDLDGVSNTSMVKIFWDGLQVARREQPSHPIIWDTSDNIYMNRFYTNPILATTFNAGLEIYKRSLSSIEMRDRHYNLPAVIDKHTIRDQNDILLDFSFENVSVDGFTIRINNVYPFNTTNTTYGLGYRDQVRKTDGSIHRDRMGVFSSIDFNPYSLPFDIPFTRALFSAMFPDVEHTHRFYLNLLDSSNGFIAGTAGFVSPVIEGLPVTHFNLKEWHQIQTLTTESPSTYTTYYDDHTPYLSASTFGLRFPDINYTLPMSEGVTFPPAGSSWKFEIIWRDLDDSWSWQFKPSVKGGFRIYRQRNDMSVTLYKADDSTLIQMNIRNVYYNKTPTNQVYKNVVTWDATTRVLNIDLYENNDYVNIVRSKNIVVDVADGDWDYGDTHASDPAYQLYSNGRDTNVFFDIKLGELDMV